jgi:DNA-binding CsgD family transcriptional regulator
MRNTELTELPKVGSRAESISVYAHALRQGGITADDEAVGDELGLPAAVVAGSIADLLALRLLRQERTGDGTRLVPVSPEVAAASLISPIGDEIYRCQAAISRIQTQLDAFRPCYDQERSVEPPGDGIDTLHDEIELSGHLYLAEKRCEWECLVFRCEGQFALERMIAMSERGVHVRLLLPHARRSDLRVRAQLKELTALGGEVRTTGRLPRQLIVFDDDAAFLFRDDGASTPLGVVIRHQEAVLLLRGVAESTWESAEPYSAMSIGYHAAVGDLHRTIVEMLADGLTDEVIARRLGISVRTCRRHIAAVLRQLGAVSRFQAGVRATAAGMVDLRRLRACPVTG